MMSGQGADTLLGSGGDDTLGIGDVGALLLGGEQRPDRPAADLDATLLQFGADGARRKIGRGRDTGRQPVPLRLQKQMLPPPIANAARTRTPTACCASISAKACRLPPSARTISTRWPPASTTAREKPPTSPRQASNSIACWLPWPQQETGPQAVFAPKLESAGVASVFWSFKPPARPLHRRWWRCR